MNITLRFPYSHTSSFFECQRKNLPPPSKSKKGLNFSTIGGGCGYPRHPGAAPAEHSGGKAWITAVPGAPWKEIISHQGINSILRHAPATFLCIKPVVVISEANLADVKRPFHAPLAHIDPHIHCPKQSFYSARGLALQSVFYRRKHIAAGILKIRCRVRKSFFPAIRYNLFQSRILLDAIILDAIIA